MSGSWDRNHTLLCAVKGIIICGHARKNVLLLILPELCS